MNDHKQYAPSPATVAMFQQFWSDRVDALERHLSSRMWALAAATVVVIVYPIARIGIPALVHAIVPDLVRTVLHLL